MKMTFNALVSMRRGGISIKFLLIFFLAIFMGRVCHATTYYWAGGAGGAGVNIGAIGTLSTTTLGTASNGSVITLTNNDIVIFDGTDIDGTSGSLTGSTPITFSTSSTPVAMGQLIFKNSVTVTFSSGTARTINVGSATSIAGIDLDIQSGSSFTLTPTASVTLGLSLIAATTGTNTASIAGTLVVGSTTQTSASGFVIAAGSTATVDGTFVHSSTLAAATLATNMGRITFNPNSTMIFRGSTTTNTTTSFAPASATFYNLTFESTSGTYTPVLQSIATALAVNGTFNIGGSGAGIVALTSTNYTGTITTNGLTEATGSSYTPNGNLIVNGPWNINGTYTHNSKSVTIGTGGDIKGNTASVFRDLIINTTTNTDVVTITKSPVTVDGNLTLTNGKLKIGATNTVIMSSASSIIGSANGNIASTGSNGGDDGGTVLIKECCGSTFNITTAPVTFYNLATNGGDGNVKVSIPSGTIINGTFTRAYTTTPTVPIFSTSSPIWGATSTLSINGFGAAYVPGLEWMPFIGGTATIASSSYKGYPHNVTLMNIGSFAPTGDWSIDGTLSIGDSTTPATVSLQTMSSFMCGGIAITNNSTLRHGTETLTVKGNWRQQGATLGIFSPTTVSSSSSVIFGGNATQIISSSTGAAITFGDGTNYSGITIINGTTVQLYSPVTLGSLHILTLNSGIIKTDATNILSLTNTATTAIAGSAGSISNMINGPLKWSLLTSGTNTYNFPIGDNTFYLPFVLNSTNTTASNAATVQAFGTNSGGAVDGTTLSAKSTSEYWSLTTTSSLGTTGSTVSITRSAAISPYNVIGKSTSAGGTYSLQGGIPGTYGVTASSDIGIASPWFFTLATQGPVISLDHTGLSQTTASNIIQNTPDNILSNFRVNVTKANATLNTISFTIGGDFVAGDLYNLKLYTNTSASLPGSALSTIDATSFIGGTSTVTFSSLAQSCLIGDRYFWITADVAINGTVNKTVIVPATPTLSFAAGDVTNGISIGGTKTIKSPVVTLDHTNLGQTAAGNIIQNTTDNILSNFRVNVTTANDTLNSISFTIGGNFVANDLTNLKLYTNTTTTFPGAALSTLIATSFVGGSTVVTFSSLNQPCLIGDRYFWVTADVASGATVNKTVIVPATPTLSFVKGVITNSIAVGGTKTILGPPPVITLNHTGLTQTVASNITQGSVDNILSNFAVNVTTSVATLNTVSFTGIGNFVAGDITNYKLYTNSSATLTGATLLSTVTATAYTGTSVISFSSLTQSCPIGATFFFITADVSSSGTINKTVIVPATPTLTFAYGTPTNNITVGGTKTIAAGIPVITLDHTGIAQVGAGNITQGSSLNILSNFRVSVTTADAILNTIAFTGTGNFLAGDITNYKLYTNTSATMSGATLLSTVAASAYTGASSVSFGSLTQVCLVSTPRFFFIVADVGTGSAGIGKTVKVPASGTSPGLVVTFASPGGAITAGVAVGGTQTISAGTPVILLDHTNLAQVTASSVLAGTTNNILSNFRINVGTADATLNSLSFTIGGNFVAGDLSNIKLYTSTTTTFPGSALATVTATSFIGGSSIVTFSALNQACVAGDRYFWITADVAAGATTAKTIIVPAAPSLTFALGTPTNNITVGGTKTISTFTTYYNYTGSLYANLLASWTTDPTGATLVSSPANFTSGDKFTLRSGTNLSMNASWTVSGGIGTEFIINGNFTQSNSFSLSGALTINSSGSFNNGNQTLTLGTYGSIGGTAVSTSSNNAFNNITINTSSSSDIVTLTKSSIFMQNGATLNINQGVFKVGTGNTINMGTTGGMTITTTANGNFATTNSNADAGTIDFGCGSGNVLTVNGPAKLYNISNTSSVNADGNWRLNFVNNTAVIYGTLTISGNQSNQFAVQNNSPAWGPNSTLYMNHNNQAYTPGLEWVAMSPGTIGTTQGYPNNVILLNCGTSASNYNGNLYGVKLSGTWSINGTLYVGNSTTSCSVDLNNGGSGTNNFTCGGIVIDNNSKLAGPNGTFLIKGNWVRQGSTIGTYIHNSGTVTFGGSGTSGSPQTISVSTGTENSFNNITISNGSYVKLSSPTSLGSSGTLTLTSGILETSSTNILSITNTATTSITGTGSNSNYINGPVKWTLANSTTNKYIFPIGKSGTYLPFDITPANAQAGNIITVEAFNTNCGGSPDNVTVTGISSTEYWSLSTTSAFTSVGSIISTGRTSGIGSNNLLANSTTVSGTYSSIGGATGTVGGTTGLTSGSISATSPWFVTLAFGPLSIVVTGTTYPSCTGTTGSVTVSGGGGTAPYEYKVGSGSYQSSGTFSGLAVGTYTFTVRDVTLTSKSINVTLDALVITADTGTCSSGSVQLTAVGATAYSYAWTPTTGLSSSTIANPLATPASTTTYTLTATVIDSTTNLISNPGFESGTASFTSGFILHTCAAYFSSWNPAPAAPCNTYGQFHNGIYMVTGNPQNLCTNLSSFAPRTGSNMMVIDGPNSSTYTTSPYPIWSQNLSGLSTNTDYVFSYWVRRGNNDDPTNGNPSIRTKINGTTLTATTYANPFSLTTAYSSAWTQITYTWNSGASTTASLEMYDETVADVANDFVLDDMTFYGTCKPTKSMTVTITPTPTLSVVTQPATACMGSGAGISLSGLTASNTFTVNYTINGVAQTPVTGIASNGSGAATFTTAVLAAINNGQTLEVTSLKNTTGNGNCTTTFTGKTVSLSVNTNYVWQVTTDDNWNLASNWCGGVPTATSNVVIPDYGSGGVYPVIKSGVSALSNNITLNNNSSVTINSSGSLTISGTYTSTGLLTNNGDLNFNGTAAQSFPGATGSISTMNNITVNNTSGLSPAVTFNNNISITGALTPTAGIINVDNALITLVSSATATARVGVVGSSFTYTGTGKFSVERYLPMQTPFSGRRWRLLGVPITATNAPTIKEAWQEDATVTPTTTSATSTTSIYNPNPGYGTHITNGIGNINNGNGFDAGSTSNPSIYKISSGLWTAPTNTGTAITNDKAYMLFVRGDRSIVVSNQYINTTGGTNLRIKGRINTGNVTISTVAGKQVLSNPYPSAISMANVTYNNVPYNSVATNTYYMWDPKLIGSKGVGGWVTFQSTGNGSSFTTVPNPADSGYMSTYGTAGKIESGGAFLINPVSGGINMVFHETDKLTTSSTQGLASRPVSGNRPIESIAEMYINLAFMDASGLPILADGVAATYADGYNNGVDRQDAFKLQTFVTKEKISLLRNDSVLAIERRATITSDDTIFLQMNKLDYNYSYQLQFIGKNFAPQLNAFLIDRFLNVVYPVSTEGITRYNFITDGTDQSIGTDRFIVVFKLADNLPLPVKFINIKAWSQTSANMINVQWNVADQVNTKEYLVERSDDGIHFTKVTVINANTNSLTYNWLDPNPLKGNNYYRIKSIDNNGILNYSEIVKVNLNVKAAIITVSPNPIDNNLIHLQMNNISSGSYKVELFNNLGQLMLSEKIEHVINNNEEVIKLKKSFSNGPYHLKIEGKETFTLDLIFEK